MLVYAKAGAGLGWAGLSHSTYHYIEEGELGAGVVEVLS